jgi:flotillin
MFESSFLLIVGVIVGIVVALLIALMLLSKNYIKVSPNQAAVISGRTRRLGDGTTVGYRQVRGGATLVVPFLEKVEYLDLNVITVPLATSRAYTSQGVPFRSRRSPTSKSKATTNRFAQRRKDFWECRRSSFTD